MTQGLNELTAHLLDEAKVQASEEEARGRAEMERYREAYAKGTAAMVASIEEETESRIEEETRRIRSQADMDAKIQLLQAKQDLLQTAFDRALELLATLPVEKRKALYLDNLMAVVEKGQETVLVAADERDLWQGILAEANQRLKQAGKPGMLSLGAEPAAIRGGFLLKGDTYEVNGSLESLLAAYEEKLRPEVARLLFA